MTDIHLDAARAREITGGLEKEDTRSLDFKEFGSIDFAAMRVLLDARSQGFKFNIDNASASVASALEDAGVTRFISVCRAPVRISLADFTQSGEGFSSITYNSRYSDCMLKLFKGTLPDSLVEKEKRCSTAAFRLGIPTPLAGAIVTDGEKRGLLYERIANKKSFSRAIADDPGNYAEYAVRFARMCRQLHSTECDIAVFPDAVKIYEGIISRADMYTAAEKLKFSDFLHSAPRATTCLHGDMHIGNVITTGKDDLWIDMSDFSYGNPLYDVAMFYIACNQDTEEFNLNYYHLDNEMMRKVWKVFACEYFNAPGSELETVNEMVVPYAVLRMVFFTTIGSTGPENLAFIRSFLDRQSD